MKTIIIRDDDTSYFTSPALLETIYGRLWEANIPVCFAVIPAPRGDVRVLHREGQPIDPSIPKQYRGESKNFSLADNPEICAFLNDKAKAGLVEICLHGFEHSYYEFEIEDRRVLTEKIEKGWNILQSALPDAKISSFIAPYDVISPVAFELLVERKFNICTSTANLKSTPYADMLAYQERSISEAQHLYAADEYFFSRHIRPDIGLEKANACLAKEDLVIVINHYWTFFYDWNGKWEAMLEAWHQYLDQIFALDKVKFQTFSNRGR